MAWDQELLIYPPIALHPTGNESRQLCVRLQHLTMDVYIPDNDRECMMISKFLDES